jgi:hypothetical protein
MAKYILKRFSRGTKEAGEKAKEFLSKKGNKIINKIKKNEYVSNLAKRTGKSIKDIRENMDRTVFLGYDINDSINSKAGNLGLRSKVPGSQTASGYRVSEVTGIGDGNGIFRNKKFLKSTNRFGYDHGNFLTDSNKRDIVDWNKEAIKLTHGKYLKHKYKGYPLDYPLYQI